MQRSTIGVFDSGVGGLTVLKELVSLLPNHSFIYFADTKNCPYGPKGTDEIVRLSKIITEFLISKGCSLIVVACNTATAAAIDHLRANYPIPFVGMEPAIKPAALNTKTKSIGVLATKGTFKGRLYQETSSKYAANINLCYKVGSGLVELVEQGESQSDKAKKLLKSYIAPMLQQNIDHIVLGCTHYPFFIPLLKEILPETVAIENPAPAVAQQALSLLSQTAHPISNTNKTAQIPFTHLYASGPITILKRLVSEIENTTSTTFQNKSFLIFKKTDTRIL